MVRTRLHLNNIPPNINRGRCPMKINFIRSKEVFSKANAANANVHLA